RRALPWDTRTSVVGVGLRQATSHPEVLPSSTRLACYQPPGRVQLGEFNWSSQHLYQEVFAGSSSAGRGQGGSSETPLAGASEVSETHRGGVLGRDRDRTARGGSRWGCRRGARGRRKMVPTRWRHWCHSTSHSSHRVATSHSLSARRSRFLR